MKKIWSVLLAAAMLVTAIGVFPAMAAEAPAAQSAVDRAGIADRIIISAFFPPQKKDLGNGAGWGPMTFDLNPESAGYKSDDDAYRLMSEVGVDFVENVASASMRSRAENLRMAELCHKYGMWLYVHEPDQWPQYIPEIIWDGKKVDVPWHYQLEMSQEDLEKYVTFWRDTPGAGGFFLHDEADDNSSNPHSMMAYGTLAGKMKAIAPDMILHTSDAPNRNIADINTFINNAKNYEGLGYLPDHIGNCEYPFQSGANGPIKGTWYQYMDKYRRIGLEHGIKTSVYLQLCAGWEGKPVPQSTYRLMGPNQIRYELYSGLAYGVKKFSIFTYSLPGFMYCPNGHADYNTCGCGLLVAAEGSLIDHNGEKTPMYEPCKEFFSQMHALSDVVFPLDARKVYHTKTKWATPLRFEVFGLNLLGWIPWPVTQKTPRAFLAQPGDSKDMLYSYMVDPDDGARYLMVVNNDTKSGSSQITHTINFKTAAGLEVAGLSEVSRDINAKGLKPPVDLKAAHTAQFTFLPGEGRLFRLDYEGEPGDPGTDSKLSWLWRP